MEKRITLKEARLKAGLTQEQIKQTTGIARTTLRAWERGDRSLKVSDLLMLCNLYGVSVYCIKLD